MKTRYEILSPDRLYVLAALTLYSDYDESTGRLLIDMIRESLAIAKVVKGAEEVIVRRRQIDGF